MQGLMMDYQLNVPAILRRAERAVRRQRDRLAAPRQVLAPLHLRRLRPRAQAARASRSAAARARRRRPRRDAHVEPPRAPRGLLRRARRRVRHAHAQPAAAPRRHHVHRDPRAATACSSSTRCCGRSSSSSSTASGSSTSSRSATARRPTGAIDYEELLARRDESAFAYRDLDERTAAAMCYTSGTTGQPEGRRLLAPGDRAALARPPRSSSLGRDERRHRPARRADVPRERVGLPVHAACSSARSRSSPARTSTRRACSTRSSSEGHGQRRRADDLDGHPAGPRRRARTGWDLSAMRSMTVGGAAPPRAMIEASTSATASRSSTPGG